MNWTSESLLRYPGTGGQRYGEHMMRILGRWFVRCGVLALALAATGCGPTVVSEEQQLHFDPSTELRSPSLEADHLSVFVKFLGQTLVEHRLYALRKGPFEFRVRISATDRTRGWIAAIEVTDGVIESHRRDGQLSRVAFRLTADDWSSYLYTPPFRRDTLIFTSSRAKTTYIRDNFEELKEVRVRIKFTGTYPNGERRDYWVEQTYRPTVLRDEWPLGALRAGR